MAPMTVPALTLSPASHAQVLQLAVDAPVAVAVIDDDAERALIALPPLSLVELVERAVIAGLACPLTARCQDGAGVRGLDRGALEPGDDEAGMHPSAVDDEAARRPASRSSSPPCRRARASGSPSACPAAGEVGRGRRRRAGWLPSGTRQRRSREERAARRRPPAACVGGRFAVLGRGEDDGQDDGDDGQQEAGRQKPGKGVTARSGVCVLARSRRGHGVRLQAPDCHCRHLTGPLGC